MLQMGREYKWSDIVKEYPDMYAIITEVKEKDGIIDSCRLMEVVPYEQEEDAVCRYMKSDVEFSCKRTTFSAPNVGVFY